MKRTIFRRFCTVLLAFCLIFALSGGAFAADTSAVAADLRLDSTEGTVTLTSNTGRAMTMRAGMKLYNGYKLTTAAKSYAYVTLDSDKVVKLDASTTAEIRKQGQKLELLVTAGQLFFNVKSPLAANETLNIRTSTMVTGIRGTAGYVSVHDAQRSSVTLLEGTVQVSTPLAQDFRTVTVTAGHRGVASVAQQQWQVDVQPLTNEDIAGFAALEIARDPDLQQRVDADSGLDVTGLANTAKDRLLADQQQAAARQEQMEAELGKHTDRVSVDPLFKETGSDTGGSSKPAPQPPTPPAAPTGSITVNVALKDENGTALTTDTAKTYTVTVGSKSADVTVDAGQSSGTVTLTDLALGEYVVTPAELTGDSLTSNGGDYNYTSTTGGRTVTLTENVLTHTVDITNTYTFDPPPTGSITLNVALSDGTTALLADVDKTYTFAITGEGVTRTVNVTVNGASASGSTVVGELPLGAYTITQTDPTGDSISATGGVYNYTSNDGPKTVTLTETALTHTVDITNTYTFDPPPTGSITLNVELSDGTTALLADVDKTYTFAITGEGVTRTVNVTVNGASASGSTVVGELPLGAYTITQTDPTGDSISATGGVYNYTSNDGPKTVTLAEGALNQTATVTNTYTRVFDSGVLELTVNLTDGTNPITVSADKTYTFTVSAAGQADKTLTVTVLANASTGSASLTGLGAGTYTITADELTGDTIGNATYKASTAIGSVTISEHLPNGTAAVTHTYVSGTVTLSLAVQDAAGAALTPVDTGFTLTLTGPATKTLEGLGPWTVTDLPLGTYTVSQTAQPATLTVGSAQYTFDKVAYAPETLTLDVDNPTGAAAVTNTYVSGSVTLQVSLKDELGNALTHTSEKIYNFTVGSQSAAVTVAAGQSVGTTTITGLAVGDYPIAQTDTLTGNQLTHSGGSYTYQKTDLPATASVTQTALAPTVAVTQTYAFDGGSVALTVQLQDMDGAELLANVDKTYKLWIHDILDESVEVAATEVLVPQGSNTGTATITELPEGTYNVALSESLDGDAITVNDQIYYFQLINMPRGLTISRSNPAQSGTTLITYGPPSVTVRLSLYDEKGALSIDTNTTAAFSVALDGIYTTNITVVGGSSSGSGEITDLTVSSYTPSLTARPDTLNIDGVYYDFTGVTFNPTPVSAFASMGSVLNVTLTYTQRPDTFTVTEAISGTQLNTYLADYKTVAIGDTGTITIADTETVTIPAGKTVQVTGSGYNEGQYGVLTNNGTMTIEGTVKTTGTGEFINNQNSTVASSGTVTCEGSFTNAANATFTNNGTFTNSAFGSTNKGSFVNNGTFASTSQFNNEGTYTVAAASTVSTTSTFANDGTMDVSGTVTVSGNQGELSTSGNLNIKSGGKVVNNTSAAEKTASFGLKNNGTVTVDAGGTLENNGDFYNGNGAGSESVLINNGTVQNTGYLINYPGGAPLVNGEATLKQCSIITNNGTFVNSGTLVNENSDTTGLAADVHGTVTNAAGATFTNETGGAVQNGGSFVNEGEYSGAGTFTNTHTSGTGTVSGTNSNQITTT